MTKSSNGTGARPSFLLSPSRVDRLLTKFPKKKIIVFGDVIISALAVAPIKPPKKR